MLCWSVLIFKHLGLYICDSFIQVELKVIPLYSYNNYNFRSTPFIHNCSYNLHLFNIRNHVLTTLAYNEIQIMEFLNNFTKEIQYNSNDSIHSSQNHHWLLITEKVFQKVYNFSTFIKICIFINMTTNSSKFVEP